MSSRAKLSPVDAMVRDAEAATVNWQRAMAIKEHWGTSYDNRLFSVSNCLLMMGLFKDPVYKLWCIHTFIECAFYSNQWLRLTTAEAAQLVKEVGNNQWQAAAAVLVLNHSFHELLDTAKVMSIVSVMHEPRQRLAFAVFAHHRIRSVVADELKEIPGLLDQLLEALQLGPSAECRWRAAVQNYETQMPLLYPPWKNMGEYCEMSRVPRLRQ